MYKRSLVIAAILLAGSAYASNDLTSLAGFTSGKALPAFEAELKDNVDLYNFFLDNPDTFAQVLNSEALQQKILNGSINLDSLDFDDLLADLPDALSNLPKRSTLQENNLRDSLGAISPSRRVNTVNADISARAAQDARQDLSAAVDAAKPNSSSSTNPIMSTPSVPPPAPLDELFNLGTLPEAGRDARGWPSYLKVPANCPAPTAGITYRHDAYHFIKTGGPDGTRIIPPRPVELQNGDSREVGHFLGAQLGASRSVSLSEREVIALPFITAVTNASGVPGDLRLNFNVDNVWADAPGARTLRPDVAISECPGDMTGANENGLLPQLGSGLTPGKRYFLNIRYPEGSCAETYSIIGATPVVRNGGPVCAFRFSNGSGFTHRPPYTGPCLPRGPYPMNYNSIHCQGSNWFANSPDLDSVVTRTRCFDPRGELAEVRYESRFVNGRKTWVLGADKPAHARMICIGSTDGNGINGSWNAIPAHEVCGRHSDGYRRTQIAIQGGGYPLARQVTQCRFDRTKRVFEWQASAIDRLIPDFPLMATPSTTVISRYVDAQGNEVPGTLRVEGPGHVSSIDPRWEDLTRPLSSFRP